MKCPIFFSFRLFTGNLYISASKACAIIGAMS